MKKTLLAVVVALTPFTASADTIYGIYGELGIGVSELSGKGSWNSDANQFAIEEDDTQNIFGSVRVEHPVPLIPNLRIALDSYDFDNNATGASFVYDGTNYGSNFQTSLEAQELTGTLYYEILDNVVSFDVGVSVKNIQTTLGFAGNSMEAKSEELDLWLPMGYASAEVSVPVVDVVVGATVEAIAFDDHEVTMFDAFIGYELVDLLAVDATIKLGYKSRDVVIDDLESFNLDLKNESIYGAIQVHF